MLEWLRCAELTCDRAALLVAQDPKVIVSLLMKLAGGSASLAPYLNVDAFLAQARAYDQADGELEDLIKQVRTAQLSHPLPVLRAREIDRWAGSKSFETLLQKHTVEYNGKALPKGGWRNW